MAEETKTADVPSEAEQIKANKAKQAKIERMEQEQKEADEAAAKSKATVSAVSIPSVDDFRQVMPRDLTIAVEARNHWEVKAKGITVEHALDPRYLWPVQHKLKRFDEVLIHDEAFRWEFRARVMRINTELKLVLITPIGELVKHDIVQDARLDFAACQIVHRGTVEKWSVMFKQAKIKTGFETEEEAREWLAIKKLAA